MRNLCLVERDDHDKDTNTQAGDAASSIEIAKVLCRCLECTTYTEDQSAQDDGLPATQSVRRHAGYKCAEESTPGKNGDDSSNLVRCRVVESVYESIRCDRTTDDTEIVAEEERA